jgi:hypothetical protein
MDIAVTFSFQSATRANRTSSQAQRIAVALIGFHCASQFSLAHEQAADRYFCNSISVSSTHHVSVAIGRLFI